MIQLQDTIDKLRHEALVISQVIATLEQLQNGTVPWKSTRGRKSMGPEERKQVSARMKRYWAGVRKAGAH